MTVESSYALAIATLSDWLNKSRASLSTNETENQNQSRLTRAIFPALEKVTWNRHEFGLAAQFAPAVIG